jgi:hypothetical protein
MTEDMAHREAALAEAELHAGLDRGPLHGIPYGLKDIVSAAGAPTTWGAFPDQRFASLAALGEIGTLEEVELPDLPYDDVAEVVIGAQAYAAFDEFVAADVLDVLPD